MQMVYFLTGVGFGEEALTGVGCHQDRFIVQDYPLGDDSAFVR